MLRNPFTPSEIASAPDDFFGRRDELKTLARSIRQGFVAIQGPIGIGKSSLLARARLLLDGFESEHTATSVIAVGHKDITSIDAAARLLLESFTTVDEKTSKVRFKLGNIFEIESGDLVRLFVENRHFSALMRIVEADHLERLLSGREMLLLAIDEADKCPVPLAQLIRAVATHAQQQGVRQLRFVTAGVSPFYQAMVDEDPGISRFFYKTITIQPMTDDEALELVETKLHTLVEEAESTGLPVHIAPNVIARIVALAGGHPHLLQLLGSHLVEREEEDPDGTIDAKDLTSVLRKICYEDRARVYDATLHMLEMNGRLEAVETLLELMPSGFPSRVDKKLAIERLGEEAVHWLMQRNIIDSRNDEDYGLVDEFLRVRLLLDEADSPVTQSDIEHYLIQGAILGRPYFDEPPEGGEHEEDEEEE